MKNQSNQIPRSIKFILMAVLILSSFGCDVNKDADLGDLSSYLEQVYSQSLEDALYIVIPVNSCDDCRSIIYRNLLTTAHKKKIKIVFSGEVREALTNHYLGRLDLMGVELLSDNKEEAKNYGLIQENYPMGFISFFDVIDGEVVSNKVLKPNMINGEVDIRKDMFKNYIK